MGTPASDQTLTVEARMCGSLQKVAQPEAQLRAVPAGVGSVFTFI